MTIQEVQQPSQLLFSCIAGSRAYGTDTPQSDTDLRGVFVAPKRVFYGLSVPEQVSDTTNDEVFYELRRFVGLCLQNNPNILELLAAPPDTVLFRHPLFERLRPEFFLSKKCKDTFAGYAIAQIKRARGLNKKIMNPLPRERKGLLDFCYVVEGHGSVPLPEWLTGRGWHQRDCGLVNIPHARGLFALFHDPTQTLGYEGVVKKMDTSNEVSLSSIPKGAVPVATMFFNQDAYSIYCREYREYWDWVENRNEHRYQNTLDHGKNYDAKNMMHTMRLLDMAEEILRDGQLIVRRPNREALLEIRTGKFEYDDLLAQAEAKLARIEALAETSPLPDSPNYKAAERALIEIRTEFDKMER